MRPGSSFLTQLIMGFFLCVSISLLYAKTAPIVWYQKEPSGQMAVHLDLFITSTCVHCQKADKFFRDIEKTIPWLRVHRYVINENKSALELFYAHIENDLPLNFSVPTMFFCGSRWTGFSDNNHTGKALLKALTYCHQKIVQQGELRPTTIATMHEWVAASQFHIENHGSRSHAFVIIMMAFTDLMNPASLFCFMAFLAFLWICAPQKSLQIKVALVFLSSISAMHYIQQMQPTLYERILSSSQNVTLWVGLLLIFSLISMYRKRLTSMHLSSKPWVYFMVVLLVLVTSVNQRATNGFNLSLVFDQWMLEQSMSQHMRLLWELTYQLIYLLPMMLLLFIYLLTSDRPCMHGFQATFKFAAYVILMSLGFLLVAYPYALGNFLLSILLFLGAIGLGFFLNRLKIC